MDDIVSLGGQVSFKCSNSIGALLFLKSPAIEETINGKPVIVRYMCDHFDSWLEHSNSAAGHELHADDLVFVTGTIKVPWAACVAFNESSYQDQHGTIKFSTSGTGNTGFSISFAEKGLPSSLFQNHGPEKTRRLSIDELLERENEGWAAPGRGRPSLQQCVFIHYYKMKRRLPPGGESQRRSTRVTVRVCSVCPYKCSSPWSFSVGSSNISPRLYPEGAHCVKIYTRLRELIVCCRTLRRR